jgi:iron(II)-dependent oxidoreductase
LSAPSAVRESTVQALQAARSRSLALTAFDEAELTHQHSPLMSPLVWDLAHIGQQEEYFLLQQLGWQHVAPDPVFHRDVAELYDAFTHSRASRIQLPLLDAAAARIHLELVRERVLELFSGNDPLADDPRGTGGPFVAALVAQHELQHVETMLATHQLRSGAALLSGEDLPTGRDVRGGWADAVLIPAGPVLIGADLTRVPTALDNERPQHTVDLPAFRIGRVPVTVADWLEFMADDGYAQPRWWSEKGWEHRQREEIVAPLFWSRDGAGGWVRRRFGVTEGVPADEPVQHIDYYEAEAFARWAGARLPTEFEWEKAAAGVAGPANLGGTALRPAPVGAYPEGASSYGVEQLLGDVWEWTSSPFSAYPGFQPMIYDNYSAPFFGPDYRVLRGGSWATDAFAVRPTFRNWDLPIRRQIFTGLRLAWDA